MKINGQSIHIPFELTHIIYRHPENVEIKVRAIPYQKDFERLVPEIPRVKKVEKGIFVGYVDDDPKYQKRVKARNKKLQDFMVVKALDVEWERVDLEDPETWENWRKEFEDAGISESECTTIIYACMNAHNPGQEAVDAARENFLRMESQKKVSQSLPEDEADSTLSGEPVNDSE